VDWWGVGILIFEMLAGYTPFMPKPTNIMALYERVIKGEGFPELTDPINPANLAYPC
jgi:serine/threonine protein kinase